jgi:hypothetical protein
MGDEFFESLDPLTEQLALHAVMGGRAKNQN